MMHSRALVCLLGLLCNLMGGVASAQRPPVESDRFMVASADARASRVGADVLQQGGNAVDAAVAVAFALAVVYPRAGNLGGGGFLVLRMGDGRATSLDFREEAPAAANRDLYLDADHHPLAQQSTVGYRASGVPGSVAGLALAYERYGSRRLSWRSLIEPARRLAEGGFTVSAALAHDLQAATPLLARFPESRHVFLRDGQGYQAGDVLRQPALAQTLARLQRSGPRDFYDGKTAKLITTAMAANNGLITASDLQHYQPIERPALSGSYRGFEVLTMPPPSSGGVALLQMLKMLTPYDVASLGHNSAAKIHLFAEVMRRAFRDRAQLIGDPDFIRVPVDSLLDQAYLTRLMADFNPESSTPSAQLAPGPPVTAEAADTTHLSVVDASGNAVSLTYTLNGLWGSGVAVPGAGFLLNNEMDDFSTQPGIPNMYGLVQGEANSIAPHKRPVSSMTPSILVKDQMPYLVTGSPGGPTIINTVLLIITNIIDHGMSVTQAVDAPRFHHQWLPDRLDCEPLLSSPDTLELLTHEGYTLASRSLYPNAPISAAHTWGDAETILVDPGSHVRLGANDPRSPDSAAVGR